MRCIQQRSKPLCIISTFLMLLISVPLEPVCAAMIGTESTLDLMRARQARDDINRLLLREDIQNTLMGQGIDPLEAKARIDSLSDAEVVRLADQIDKLPAGGGYQVLTAAQAVGIIAVVVLIIAGLIYLGYRLTND